MRIGMHPNGMFARLPQGLTQDGVACDLGLSLGEW